MEVVDGTVKIVLLDAKLFVRTKRVSPQLVLSHKEMLDKGHNFRIPINHVTMLRQGIAAGFTSSDIALTFSKQLPKRIFVVFVSNAAVSGARNLNPYNFANFGIKSLSLYVNGMQNPTGGLQMDYTKKQYARAYLNTLSALGMDVANRVPNFTLDDFSKGYAIYGFKIAPGVPDGTVHSAANNQGGAVIKVAFDAALTANVDMIVYAETPQTIEIDKFNAVTIVS
jgi:hypothetical protein